MSPRSLPPRATVPLCLALMLVPAGCTADPPSQAPPAPEPVYEPAPRDLCARMRVDDFAARYDLTIPPGDEPSDTYLDDPGSWHTVCGVLVIADDDRYETGFGRFYVIGQAAITGYDELPDAAEEYHSAVDSFRMHSEGEPQSVIGPASGWWDEGYYAQNTNPADVTQYDVDPETEATRVDVDYAVRHHNLLIWATMYASFPPEDVEDAYPLLHDMVRTWMDEARTYLTLSDEDTATGAS